MKLLKRFQDWIFGAKQWEDISSMTDEQLRWEFCRLLAESDEGRYDTTRFRRVCYQMALRFERQDAIPK